MSLTTFSPAVCPRLRAILKTKKHKEIDDNVS